MAKESEYNSLKDILITVEGGAIQDIDLPPNCSIRVIVRDYDIDGTEEDRLIEDMDGNQCVEGIWSASRLF